MKQLIVNIIFWLLIITIWIAQLAYEHSNEKQLKLITSSIEWFETLEELKVYTDNKHIIERIEDLELFHRQTISWCWDKIPYEVLSDTLDDWKYNTYIFANNQRIEVETTKSYEWEWFCIDWRSSSYKTILRKMHDTMK